MPKDKSPRAGVGAPSSAVFPASAQPSPRGAQNGGHRAKTRKLRTQEEFNATPPCPMLYAVLPPELQQERKLQEQTLSRVGGTGLAQAPRATAGADAAQLRPDTSPPLAGPAVLARPGYPGPAAIPVPGMPSPSPALSALHVRARSWDVHDLSRQMLTGQLQPALSRVPFETLSLAVECLIHSAMVTLEASWVVECGTFTPPGTDLDCLFVLPMHHKGSVCGVEVLPGEGRMLATAVIPKDEAHCVVKQVSDTTSIAPVSATASSSQLGRTLSKTSRFLPRTTTGSTTDSAKLSKKASVTRRTMSSSGAVPMAKSDEREGEEQGGLLGLTGRLFSTNASQHSSDVAAPNGIATAVGVTGSRDPHGDAFAIPRQVEGDVAATLLEEPEGHCPCMFRIRVPKVKVGSRVQIRVTYLESMALRAGYQEIVIPLTLPWDCVNPEVPLHRVVRVSCMINSGMQKPMKIGDFNHPMKVMFVELGRATFVGHPSEADPDTWPNTDFCASYQVVSSDVYAGALAQAPVVADRDARASFCLSIWPSDSLPPNKKLFPRAIIFIVDSQTSLRSKPMDDARRAIASALKRLNPADTFTLLAFDYELLLFSDELVQATPDNVKKACKFILRAQDLDEEPHNILTPLDVALKLFKSHNTTALPQIILVTDGCVAHERQICELVQSELMAAGSHSPRIFPFGIGPNCNYYFLKWLSSVSHGCLDISYNLDDVRRRLEKLLEAIARPLITNITVKDLPPGCELLPYPIPDLYLGAPVVVSGKMSPVVEDEHGTEFGLPLHLQLRGRHSDGSSWKFKAQLVDAGNAPLNSVGIKEQMDIATSDAWLHDDPSLDTRVLASSVAASVPSEQTRMVFFETTAPLFDDFQRHRVQGTRGDMRGYLEPRALLIQEIPGLTLGYGRSATTGRLTKREDSSNSRGILSLAEGDSRSVSPMGSVKYDRAGQGSTGWDTAGLGGLSPSSIGYSIGDAASDVSGGSVGPQALPLREDDIKRAGARNKGGIFSSVLSCYRPQ